MKQLASQTQPNTDGTSLLISGTDAFYYANCLAHVLRVSAMPDEPEPVDEMSLSALQSLLELLQSVHPRK